MLTFKQIFGKKLRILRELHGDMTQAELGHALGYSSTGTISLIESGQRGMDNNRMAKTAELFGVNIAVLLSKKDMTKEEIELYVHMESAISTNSEHLSSIKGLLRLAYNEAENRKKKTPPAAKRPTIVE